MRSTNQPLTDRELIFVERQFKIIQYKNKLPWIICGFFACLGLLGMMTGNGQTFFFLAVFIASAVTGFFFFKRNSYQTTFDIIPTGMMQQGVLSIQPEGTLFLDEHRLETPGRLKDHCSDLVEKYKDQMVNLTLAVLEERKDTKLHKYHYLPLKIEYELCIESAVKNHGADFLKNILHQSSYTLLATLLLFLSIPLSIVFLLDYFDYLKILPLAISMFLALFVAIKIQENFIPDEEPLTEIELKEKLKCTCL